MSEHRLKANIGRLYRGSSPAAARFRYGLIGFDVLTIGFFIATAPLDPTLEIFIADIVIGLVILADFAARLWIERDRRRMILQIYTIADLVVIASLLLAPFLTADLMFLRVLRSLRLLRSYHVLRDLRRETPFFRRNEDVIVSTVNLIVFIFFMTALVFVVQKHENPSIHDYVDALYFTVTTLTTTGFGDITLTGTMGRLVSVFIMVFGVALFLRLVQTIFRPQKVYYACPECGLNRHEADAIHCKHCGHTLKIGSSGDTSISL